MIVVLKLFISEPLTSSISVKKNWMLEKRYCFSPKFSESCRSLGAPWCTLHSVLSYSWFSAWINPQATCRTPHRPPVVNLDSGKYSNQVFWETNDRILAVVRKSISKCSYTMKTIKTFQYFCQMQLFWKCYGKQIQS